MKEIFSLLYQTPQRSVTGAYVQIVQPEHRNETGFVEHEPLGQPGCGF